MKCPKCEAKQKASSGAACPCGYRFALNPKDSPYLSDRAMAHVIDKLSGNGQYYFTFNQLYSALHKAGAEKKKKNKRVGSVLIVIFTVAIAGLVAKPVGLWLSVIVALAGIAGLIAMLRWRPEAKFDELTRVINHYRSLHPIANMVDGTRFKVERTKEELKKELFDYAPERILIAQNDQMVDMLVMNRFHFENKTIIVSANKYPEHVFNACQKFLAKKPDIPVELLHDASWEGVKLKGKLQADKTWNLEGKNMVDLGLSLQDVANIKDPVWLPGRKTAAPLTGSSTGAAEDKINRGMRFPADFAPPSLMMGVLTAAVIGGLAFMSAELLAAQAAKTGQDYSGGFG
jgi:hypothetical protein